MSQRLRFVQDITLTTEESKGMLGYERRVPDYFRRITVSRNAEEHQRQALHEQLTGRVEKDRCGGEIS